MSAISEDDDETILEAQLAEVVSGLGVQGLGFRAWSRVVAQSTRSQSPALTLMLCRCDYYQAVGEDKLDYLNLVSSLVARPRFGMRALGLRSDSCARGSGVPADLL
eukprot:2415360-Rhodomonas_salina.2